jgi:hypothetical protein
MTAAVLRLLHRAALTNAYRAALGLSHAGAELLAEWWVSRHGYTNVPRSLAAHLTSPGRG